MIGAFAMAHGAGERSSDAEQSVAGRSVRGRSIQPTVLHICASSHV